MGTLYLHLGLAKTATTALQNQFFPKLKKINYLHREIKDKNSLSYKIATYCFSAEEDLTLLYSVKTSLESLLRETDVLISEEWFTMDYSWFYGFKGASWQEKLFRLGSIVEEFDFKILITTREPVSGLFSLYCELYNVAQYVRNESFISFIETSNDALSYDLASLNKVIDKAFNQSPYLLPYEMLHSDNDFLSALLTWLDRDNYVEFTNLRNENKTERTESNVVVYSRSFIQKIAGRLFQLAPSGYRSWLRQTFIYKSLYRIFLASRKKYQIPTPELTDIEVIRVKFKSTVEYYKSLEESRLIGSG